MNFLSLQILAIVSGMLVNNIVVSADQIERGPSTDYATAVDFEEKTLKISEIARSRSS